MPTGPRYTEPPERHPFAATINLDAAGSGRIQQKPSNLGHRKLDNFFAIDWQNGPVGELGTGQDYSLMERISGARPKAVS